METALDALPARPLAVEDVATLNGAATVRVIPHMWFGEQVIAALLLYDERDTDENAGAVDDSVPDTDAADDVSTDDEPAFGGRDESIGTVEVIEDESLTAGSAFRPATDRAGDLSVFAVGYDDSAGSWMVVTEIDPDAEFTAAEAPKRRSASG
jgi:hypothetical protein